MSLGLEQNYAQKLLQLAEDKSKCKIWTMSKYDEIVGNKRTPYKAMLGVEAKVGLTLSSLPD